MRQIAILKLVVFIFCMPLTVIAQYSNDYTPIQNTGLVPSGFYFDPVKETQKNVTDNKILSAEDALLYYTNLNYYKYRLFQSGDLYLKNELTDFIDSVVAKLLSVEPQLMPKLKFYLTRYTSANAYCLADGSVFVNVGLLAVLDNEAELAFILSHEIAHFVKQHNVKDFSRLSNIKTNQSNYYNHNSNKFLNLKYSRESEFDADDWAADLAGRAGYDINLAVAALHKLKPVKDSATLDYSKIFKYDGFTLDTALIGKTAASQIKKARDSQGENQSEKNDQGDLFETHPDIDKRIEAMSRLVKYLPAGKVRPDNQRFNRIRLRAEFEKVENNHFWQDYISALTNALKLLKKYPENAYLHTSISQSLYWVGYYKEISNGELSMSGDAYQNSTDFYSLYYLLGKMDVTSVKSLAYFYTRSKASSYSGKEAFLFYQAINTENFLGATSSRSAYRDYLKQFPTGEYSNFVKLKLKQ